MGDHDSERQLEAMEEDETGKLFSKLYQESNLFIDRMYREKADQEIAALKHTVTLLTSRIDKLEIHLQEVLGHLRIQNLHEKLIYNRYLSSQEAQSDPKRKNFLEAREQRLSIPEDLGDKVELPDGAEQNLPSLSKKASALPKRRQARGALPLPHRREPSSADDRRESSSSDGSDGSDELEDDNFPRTLASALPITTGPGRSRSDAAKWRRDDEDHLLDDRTRDDDHFTGDEGHSRSDPGKWRRDDKDRLLDDRTRDDDHFTGDEWRRDNEDHFVDERRTDDDHSIDERRSDDDHSVEGRERGENQFVDERRTDDDHSIDERRSDDDHSIDERRSDDDHSVEGRERGENQFVDEQRRADDDLFVDELQPKGRFVRSLEDASPHLLSPKYPQFDEYSNDFADDFGILKPEHSAGIVKLEDIPFLKVGSGEAMTRLTGEDIIK